MIVKNSLSIICEFFSISLRQFRKLYLNSTFYNKKISKFENKPLVYKPPLSIISCLIEYDKKKNKIENFYVNSIWENQKIKDKDYKILHSFYWLFTIDLKSSKKITQSIIQNWIEKNKNYNSKSWQIDILSKRIISWISNSKLTYEETDNSYKIKFNKIICKQINHLINEINRSNLVNDKMLGCTAIIINGLSFNNEKFLEYGLNLLKKIINSSFDNQYFPKSRSIKQLVFYLKHFVLIRELLKDSLNEIPEYLNEIIFYLGGAYNILQISKESFLFNGNNETDLSDFDKYLDLHRYRFKNNNNQIGGYSVLKNKNTIICMDIGSTPSKKFSENYQSGPLSFELIFNGKKLICNSGYFQDYNSQLNLISKSTAAHSTMVLNNRSTSSFIINRKGPSLIDKGFKVFEKNVVYEKNFWCIKASHDGYLKEYGIIHERAIEYYPESFKIIGKDKLISKKNIKKTNFVIRFHLMPNSKLTKTQDKKAVLIELQNSGWRFYSENLPIDIDTGLYFGKKNTSNENQNIFISGITQDNDQLIKWELNKI